MTVVWLWRRGDTTAVRTLGGAYGVTGVVAICEFAFAAEPILRLGVRELEHLIGCGSAKAVGADDAATLARFIDHSQHLFVPPRKEGG